MKYIVDADLILETILNRSKTYEQVAKLWNNIYTKSSEIYISRIGLDRINTLIKVFIEIEEDATQAMNLITDTFKVIEVDTEIIDDARQIDLIHNDFESSVEIVIAEEYKFNGIITERYDSFRHTNSNSETSSKYKQKVMDIDSFCVDIQRYQFQPEQNHKLEISIDSNDLSLSPEMGTKQNYLKSFLQLQQTDSSDHILKDIPALTELSFDSDDIMDFYMDLAQRHGGDDWGDYQENCEVIAAEWDNFEKILSYCWVKAKLSEGDYYIKFVKLWNLLNRFCDLYGKHNDRIFWLDKIIYLSKERENWSDYLSALTSKAWTLIMINRLDETRDCKVSAKSVLELAGEKLELVNDSFLFFRYYHCLNLYYTHNGRLPDAEEALIQQRYSLGLIETENTNGKLLIRCKINHISNFGKIAHEEGLMKIDPDNKDNLDYNLAKTLFAMLSCLDLAISIGWQRGICYLCNKIANINLDLAQITEEAKEKQNLLNRVGEYLKMGQPISDRNECNKRRTGSYLLSFARLELMQNDYVISENLFSNIPSTYIDPNIALSSLEEKALKAIHIFEDGGNQRKARQVVGCFPGLGKKLINLGLLNSTM
jgi:hypothetical protein